MTFEQPLGTRKQIDLDAGGIEYYERGDGRPLIFIHGLGLSATFWREVVAPLAEEYRCITPTWPLGGHRVGMKPSADLSPVGIAAIVAEFLDRLELRDAVIVGNDTGGAFAQIVATRHPERLGALVLTPSDAFKNFLPMQFRPLQILARIPGAVWATSQLFRSAMFRRSPLGLGSLSRKRLDDDLTRSWAEPLWTNADARRDVAKVLKGIRTRYTMEAAERLSEFDRPVLIAWAADDRVFPAEHARALAEILPNSRLHLIDDSGSYVPEDAPEALVAVMRTFLRPAARPAGADVAVQPA